jgi:hypothetical protein
MATERLATELRELSDQDLTTLRLGAQVMAHKAELERSQPGHDFFAQLEAAALAELASRTTGILSLVELPDASADGLADADRTLITSYLELLADNEQLSLSLRQLCRRLMPSAA